MKKTLVTLLVLTFAVFAFACGGESPNANANKNTNTNKPATPAPIATLAPPVNNNTAPVNGNTKTNATTPGKTVDEKMKAKEDATKATPAPAATKKP